MKNTIKSYSAFSKVIKKGFIFKTSFFNAFLLASTAPKVISYGILIGRKFSKKAVERNKVKRVLREVVRSKSNSIVGKSLVLIPKRNIGKAKFDVLLSSLESAVKAYDRYHESKISTISSKSRSIQ